MADDVRGHEGFHVYVVRRGDLELEAPVERVWPELLSYTSWQNYSVVQHISGEPGGEGEVVLLQKDEKGSSSLPYYARTVKIDPLERVIWKTFREGHDYSGIVEFEIDDLGGRTRFSYRTLYEHVFPSAAEAEAFRSERETGFTTLTSTVFPQLKRLVETGAGG